MAELWQALNDNSGAVIAGFTVILAFTTIAYVVVSIKLLKQSKNAFLADMVVRMMEIHRSRTKEIEKGERRGKDPVMEGWTKGYSEAFMEIDKKFGKDLVKLMVVGLEAASKKWIEQAKKLEKEIKRK